MVYTRIKTSKFNFSNNFPFLMFFNSQNLKTNGVYTPCWIWCADGVYTPYWIWCADGVYTPCWIWCADGVYTPCI